MTLATRVGVYVVDDTSAWTKKRQCARCGISMSASVRRNTPVCTDCRSSDPEYVRAIKMKGQRA
jgi:ribosomal protein S27AE